MRSEKEIRKHLERAKSNGAKYTTYTLEWVLNDRVMPKGVIRWPNRHGVVAVWDDDIAAWRISGCSVFETDSTGKSMERRFGADWEVLKEF